MNAPASQGDLDLLPVFAALPTATAVFAVDAPRFTVLAANDALLAMARRPRDALIGRPAEEAFPNASGEDPQASGVSGLGVSLAISIQTGAPQRMERYNLVRADGTSQARYWEAVNIPVRGSSGDVQYVLHQIRDVTTHVQAAASRAQIERRAESILERMGDAHCVLDSDYRIVSVNAATERLLGVPRTALEGRSHWEAFPGSVDAPVGHAIRRVISEGVEEHITHHYTGEGYDLHLEFDAYPTEGRGLAMFWRDVTERVHAQEKMRASEEKYRALFSQMDEAYAVVEVMADAAGRWTDFLFLEVNPAFMWHTGMPYPVGRTATQLLGTPNPRWAELYGRAAESGESIRLEESEFTLGRTFDLNIFRLGGSGSRQVAVLFTDITERKRAELALRESEARQAFLLKLSDALRGARDARDIHATVTRLARDHLAADRCYYCEIDGDVAIIRQDGSRAGLPSVAGTYSLAAMPLFTAAFANGQPLIVEDAHTATILDEELRVLCLQMQVISFIDVPVVKNGKAAGMLCITQSEPRRWTDSEVALAVETAERTWAAAERAHAETALRVSEARLNLALDVTQIGTFVWYPEADRGDTDARTLALYGLEPGDSLNHARGLSELVVPEDRAAHAAKVAQALDPGGDGMLRSEYRIRRARDGATRWIATLAQTQFAGEPRKAVSITGVAADITDRKRAEAALRENEERLRRAVSIPTVGVLFFRLDGIILEVNAALERMIGYSLEELRALVNSPLLTPPEFAAVTARASAELAEHGRTAPYEKQWIRRDGSRMWGLFTPTRLAGTGSDSECVEFIIDITRAKEAEEVRRQTEDALRVLVTEREALIRELHHRVKNNLQVITSLLEMQARQVKDARALSSLTEARHRVAVIGTIHQLLYQSPSLSHVGLHHYAEQLIPHVVSLYEKSATLRTRVHGDEVTVDLARAVPIGLLLNELVANTCKHAFPEDAAGELDVELRQRGGRVHLRVSDTGVGLPAGFDARESKTLGLQLVHMLAKQVGGTVAFQSSGGTTVDVELPA